MNKIYNNLNIENLIKTEALKQLTVEQKEELLTNSQWFNQFDETQQTLIMVGIKKNLDVSWYADLRFDWLQMREIFWGLEDNLDVSIYAKTDFDGHQMTAIRIGLQENLNVSIYAKTEYTSHQMTAIRLKLKNESTLL